MRSGTLGGSYALSIPVKPGRGEGGGVLSEHLKLWRSSWRGTFDEAGSGLFVESFHIPLLTNVDWSVNKYLKELEARLSMEAPGSFSILCTHGMHMYRERERKEGW